MRSGNPSKAARQMRLSELRAAVGSGKTALVRPWPGTEVTIRSSNPDYAESVVSFIEIMDPRNRELSDVQSLTHLLGLFLTAYMTDEKNHGHLSRWLTQAQQDLELMRSV